MIKDLTFKEYIESKKRLKESVEKNKSLMLKENHYKIIKHNKLAVGRSQRKYIWVKPNDELIVETVSKDNEELILSLKIKDKKTQKITKYNTDWNMEKLSRWINNNTSGLISGE